MDINVEIKSEQKGIFSVNCLSSDITFYVDVSKELHPPKGPNPLEVFLSALASCIGVYAEKYLVQHMVEFTQLKINASAKFSEDSPARLIDIKVKVTTNAKLDNDMRMVFLRFIKNCPIHNTVINTKEVDISLT